MNRSRRCLWRISGLGRLVLVKCTFLDEACWLNGKLKVIEWIVIIHGHFLCWCTDW